jgi:hypothetical protein
MRGLAAGVMAAAVCFLAVGCDDGGGGGGGGTDAGRLVGIWQGSNEELVLKDDGTFSRTVTWGGLMTWDIGLYEVGGGFIHFAVQDHEPKEYLGQPLSYVTSFTYFYTFVDNDHVVFEDHLINTQWDMYRQ